MQRNYFIFLKDSAVNIPYPLLTLYYAGISFTILIVSTLTVHTRPNKSILLMDKAQTGGKVVISLSFGLIT